MITIDKYSHNFAMLDLPPVYITCVSEFCRELLHITYTRSANGNIKRDINSVFAFRRSDKREFRFHINHLEAFIKHLYKFGITQYEIIEHAPPAVSTNIEFELNPKYELLDYQLPIFDFLINPGYKKVVELQPGKGKTVVALAAVAHLKMRTMLIIKPMYFDRWLEALSGEKHILNLNPNKDIMVVSGSQALAGLIDLAQNNQLKSKFIIMSNVTLANYYEYYKENGIDDKYGFTHPGNLYGLLGVGIKLVDEAHMDFHRTFIGDLFTNVYRSIELSATLTPDDLFLAEMYKVIYPKELRIAAEYDRYIHVLGLSYKSDPSKNPINYTVRGRTSYSQVAYEQFIMKNKGRLAKLLNFLNKTIEQFFLSVRYENSRLLILADTVAMCEIIRDYLRDLYPDLVVNKYTQEDSYEVFDISDVIVSTSKSAGTAIDISKLQAVISIVNRGSKQSMEQYVGRLRKPKANEFTPYYIYLMNTDIPAHRQYHIKNINDFKLKALKYETIDTYEQI